MGSRSLAAALVLSALSVAAASAQGQATPPKPQICNPDWERVPDGEDRQAGYPPAPAKAKQPGYAKMQCHITANGRLIDCTILEETPPAQGFGEATLKLAPKFRMRPTTCGGRPVEGGIVVIPYRWSPDELTP